MLTCIRVRVSGGKVLLYRSRVVEDVLMQHSPYVKTNGEWIANRIVTGLMIAPIEALPEIAVTDVVCIYCSPYQTSQVKTAGSSLHTSVAFTWAFMLSPWLVAITLRLSSVASLLSTKDGDG